MKIRAHRHTTRSAIMLNVRGTDRHCTISSISTSGACIVGARDLYVGEDVVLDYPNSTATATVIWSNSFKAGVAFRQKLSSECLNRIRNVAHAGVLKTSHRMTLTEMR